MKILNDIVYYNKNLLISNVPIPPHKKKSVFSPDVKIYTQNKQADFISFGAKNGAGIPAQLPEVVQRKVQNIHNNLDIIQNFFQKYTKKNPMLGALIKKRYSDVVPRRQSAIVFKLPNTDNTLRVMRSQTRKEVLFLSIENGEKKYNGIILDGLDKLISNYLIYHPHMLPREFKYMDSDSIAEIKPENFINLADEKLQAYVDYIKGLQSGDIPMPKVGLTQTRKAWLDKNGIKTTRIVNDDNINIQYQPKIQRKEISEQKTEIPIQITEKPMQKSKILKQNAETQKHKKQPEFIKSDIKDTTKLFDKQLSNAEYENYIINKTKFLLKKITNLLNLDVKNFPDYIIPKVAPSGKALGFKIITDDGGTLIVTKKANANYGNSMPYLSFEKHNKDNSIYYISIDMLTNKILRTKDKGKPHISSDHIVYELTMDELKRRKIEEKLDYFMSQIFK